MGQESVFLPERFAVREITLVETGRRERELLDIGQKDQGFLDPFGNPLQEGIHFLQQLGLVCLGDRARLEIP